MQVFRRTFAGPFTKHGRAPDLDHAVPYDKNGPPGQTGDHNDTPLSRHHRRAKAHLASTVLQLGPDLSVVRARLEWR
ncbi:hypothetical protein [Nocardioides daeguensis]|uniref:HNH endonuclease n=1 Tax=Nocardioides daeguensis TaxID=908359 RepID=A0ABP6WL04_9ACTN|nr:hypothetical protein [Nocardioides daeguensis]MBV6729111.1 hypothetical protein [Nocardioides daeguensis]MCR1774885.1 hypothetical protein [Nocardioides daeguensis]